MQGKPRNYQTVLKGFFYMKLNRYKFWLLSVDSDAAIL